MLEQKYKLTKDGCIMIEIQGSFTNVKCMKYDAICTVKCAACMINHEGNIFLKCCDQPQILEITK